MERDLTGLNADELLSEMEADERADQELMSPRDYASYRARKTGLIIRPQVIYYYLRTGKLTWHTCPCGRRVVNVKEADEVLDGERAE